MQKSDAKYPVNPLHPFKSVQLQLQLQLHVLSLLPSTMPAGATEPSQIATIYPSFLRSTSDALIPPNPNEFVSTICGSALRPCSGT